MSPLAYTGHTQKNGAVLIMNTIKNAPLFCVCPVFESYGFTYFVKPYSCVDDIKVKVKVTLEQAMKAQRRSRGIALIFYLTSALDGGGWLTPRSGRFTPVNDPVI